VEGSGSKTGGSSWLRRQINNFFDGLLDAFLDLLEHMDQVPGDRVLVPVPQGALHQLSVEAVGRAERAERFQPS
jgi:hypothetical protein